MKDKLTEPQERALKAARKMADTYGRLPICMYELWQKGIYPSQVMLNLSKKGYVAWVPGYWQLTEKGKLDGR